MGSLYVTWRLKCIESCNVYLKKMPSDHIIEFQEVKDMFYFNEFILG